MFHRALLSALLVLTSGAAAADLGHAINDSLRAVRAQQNEDGTYGPADAQPLATARVLQAFGLSPEHYTTQDGPFVRRAAEALVARQDEDGGFAPPDHPDRTALTAEVVLALRATGRTEPFLAARERGVRFLTAARSGADVPPVVALALDGDGAPPLRHVRSLLVAGETIDPAGDWVDGIVDRLLQAQETALADLTAAGILPFTNRLLALIEAAGVERSTPTAARKPPAEAPERPNRPLPANPAEQLARIEAALDYLAAAQHDGRFGFGQHSDAGITAIALGAVIQASATYGLERPAYVEAGLEYLASLQKEDGGIYDVGLKNYITSVAVEALVASGDERFAPVVQRATDFLMATQLDEDEGYSAEEDPYYGGFGYGSSEKPDLSNTQLSLQALHVAGIEPQDAAFQKAIRFLSRCQNLEESGITSMRTYEGEEIVAGSDGGAVYRPGSSKAGTEEQDSGKLVARSYGSMTYALLKSYLFAGLDPDDPRVRAAVEWIGSNYTLEVNPGFPTDDRGSQYQGLYYYYLTMARALAALGDEALVGPDGETRDWRTDLRNTLFRLQAEDGHWINRRSSRWMEGNPVLTTSYALLALVAAEQD